MDITVTTSDDIKRTFNFELHAAIDQMVTAIKENLPDWKEITIRIINH